MKNIRGIFTTALIEANKRLENGYFAELQGFISNFGISSINDEIKPELLRVALVWSNERGNDAVIMVDILASEKLLKKHFNSQSIETCLSAFAGLTPADKVTALQKMKIRVIDYFDALEEQRKIQTEIAKLTEQFIATEEFIL